MNLARNLENAAFYFPDRPALREGARELTYDQLNRQANRVATALIREGLRPGESIGLCAPNSIDWIVFYFGVLKAGAVAVTLSGLLTGEELTRLVRHAAPRWLFTTASKLEALSPLKGPGGIEKMISPDGDLDLSSLMALGIESFRALERDRTDPAAVLYTGGTTGIPKGVLLSQEAMAFSSHAVAYCERSTENDLALCFMPFNHVFGQIHIMNGTLYSCGCLELLPAFDLERIMTLMAAGRVTKFFAVPTVYIRLLSLSDLERKLGRLRYCFSAAASMPREIVNQWKERTGITIAESYGMTEGMPVTYNHYYRHVVGSVGTPVQGVEVEIRDPLGNRVKPGEEGEICLRGPNVMIGYLNNPEETAGLLGGRVVSFRGYRPIRRGRLSFYRGPLEGLDYYGGENVYPREVEEILYTSPQVEECAIIGVPDREWGERVTAFIVPKPGETIAPEELKSFLKTRLSSFKVPKEYISLV